MPPGGRRPPAPATSGTPGVTATQILLGGTGPLSGPESQYEPVLTGAQAYFSYVNDHGGVYGRKIVYKVEDDSYDPAKTVQFTRKLVEQDKVFAIFNTIGTEHSLADPRLPQPDAGARAVRRQRRDVDRCAARADPVDDGPVAELRGRGRDLRPADRGQRIRAAKIAVLYENDEYGMDLLAGLKSGLGSHAGQIVSTASYEPTDVTVDSQVQQLKASGADTFMIFALPTQAIQAFVSAAKLGWKPIEYVTSVSIDPAVMQIVHLNAGAQVRRRRNVDGVPARPDEPDPAESGRA